MVRLLATTTSADGISCLSPSVVVYTEEIVCTGFSRELPVPERQLQPLKVLFLRHHPLRYCFNPTKENVGSGGGSPYLQQCIESVASKYELMSKFEHTVQIVHGKARQPGPALLPHLLRQPLPCKMITGALQCKVPAMSSSHTTSTYKGNTTGPAKLVQLGNAGVTENPFADRQYRPGRRKVIANFLEACALASTTSSRPAANAWGRSVCCMQAQGCFETQAPGCHPQCANTIPAS